MGALLFQNRVIPITDQLLARGLGILDVGERPNLHMEELVSGGGCCQGRVPMAFESVYECVSIFLLADGCYLHEVPWSGRRGLSWRLLPGIYVRICGRLLGSLAGLNLGCAIGSGRSGRRRRLR